MTKFFAALIVLFFAVIFIASKGKKVEAMLLDGTDEYISVTQVPFSEHSGDTIAVYPVKGKTGWTYDDEPTEDGTKAYYAVIE